jgi:hypothetical protein
MFTEKGLRDNAHLVKALMGIAAEDFYSQPLAPSGIVVELTAVQSH